ncbi:MAG: DUF1648 domain-containing protein [Bacteroidales bacterium]|nr:DUF1648 domain-containing protein [Bacteroidales bacterium]MCF8456589.1 DUF1648 domain-containing protein [Bacteroidales bacterium]
MKRPKLKIEMEPLDWIIEGIGIVALIGLVALPFLYFDDLPERIPHHFDIDGNVDRYGGKGMIWFLPVLGLILYTGMAVLNRFPHIFNYPGKITDENALRQYTLATRLLRGINTIIACFFLYISYQIIQSSMEEGRGFGSWPVILFLLLILGLTIIYFIRARKE